MRLPNKLYTYEESTLSNFPIILRAIGKDGISVADLSQRIAGEVGGVLELIEELSAISIITKDLTRKLIQTKKGGNPYGTDEKDESCYRRPTFL